MPTPHTRGSTLQNRLNACRILAYPAHAGIDLMQSMLGTGFGGLPRTRGDRPHCHYCTGRSSRPTPHTRGSTPPGGTGVSRTGAYPAHAGIDLSKIRSRYVEGSLPRTRGDRPKVKIKQRRSETPTPHTRGSTPTTYLMRGLLTAYPAHAGIDRRHMIRTIIIRSLPRTRGDRPCSC